MIRNHPKKNHNKKYKKQLQKIGEGSRDGNANKYSNKGGRDDNKHNRHPYITHISLHTHSLTKRDKTVLCDASVHVCVV